jgi:eukaryotic-like serine/threonine-protein kinase
MSEPTPPEDTRAADTSGKERLLAELTDDFLQRHRGGERPSVDEYTSKHPDLASRILELFPMMLAMEQRGATTGAALYAERVGSTVGRYKLLERIGEGGFGVVYMAEQLTPVRRKVAIKVVKPGYDTRQVIARFEAERQALALMDHENIAKVLDAGATDSGRPYFVMELVHGVPITEYCDNNELPSRERLELFVKVCRAVQHAHTKGIIHRDIKPTNVLVTLHEGVAVPKVIDFGVAKATGQQLTEKTLFTNFAQMVGTPLYMSPEQAEMSSVDVDTRSDVYSLGVLLYELLTGTTPLDKERLKRSAFDEIRRIIREEEPARPSTRISTLRDQAKTISARRKSDPANLGRLLRGELDWIVMKALDKDRSRRFETANGLAMDVQRYLNDETVQAYPPSAAYRFKKFARRNKGTLVASAAVAATLLLGIAISTWQAVRATRYAQAETKALALAQANERAANENAAKAEAARLRAEKSFYEVRTAFKEVLGDAVAGDGKWMAVPLPARKVLAEDAMRFYLKFVRENDPEPAARFETASSLRAIALMQERVGETELAEKTYRQSIDSFKQLLVASPKERRYRQQLALGNRLLANLLLKRDRDQEAAEPYRAAAKLNEELLDEQYNPDQLFELACCYSGLITIDRSPQNAQRLCTSILRRLDQSEKRPTEASVSPINEVARLLLWTRKADERHLPRAIELARKSIAISPDFHGAWLTLGAAQYRAGDWKATVAALEKSVTLSVGADPLDLLYLAMAHFQLGHRDEARRQYDLAVAAIDNRPGAERWVRRLRAEAAALLKIEDATTRATQEPNRN